MPQINSVFYEQIFKVLLKVKKTLRKIHEDLRNKINTASVKKKKKA